MDDDRWYFANIISIPFWEKAVLSVFSRKMESGDRIVLSDRFVVIICSCLVENGVPISFGERREV